GTVCPCANRSQLPVALRNFPSGLINLLVVEAFPGCSVHGAWRSVRGDVPPVSAISPRCGPSSARWRTHAPMTWLDSAQRTEVLSLSRDVGDSD
ncbi:hypothetical protein GDO81_018351, partial [Engystomops pustulosus]